jgi:ABC-type proline/glycine betaine transport system permease subunit
LVKPIQSQIRKDHFNRATICALVANCLQFQKEAQQDAGNAGVSKTRAMVSELLAIRLLKEFSLRELIDALSYDFNPLEGLDAPEGGAQLRQYNRSARISTVEIAIRAQAKRFLAHPLVVQQLEAIWAGSIVFHSAADNLHRKPPTPPPTRGRSGYGTIVNNDAPQPAPIHNAQPSIRRSVTLYNPKDASLFKLSRLRVPRYRQLFSTLSFTIMLGLFLAVLVDRSTEITPLEIIFWFWSAGYMLDELVGFSEQGFGLYIMSVWNAFDLGILLCFFAYYVLRLYGVLIPAARKHYTAHMAYDVLASTAVLLFPRAFSVLDHYKYFSQLLIAFRLMVQDMIAILVLIVIACSGFFVAFTLSFSEEKAEASKVAYALFQLTMGFTPAAWDLWPKYNLLGKAVLVGFLFLCHFLIVTILITVLTNSFMAIVQNANEEHQFLFAVNTISMVKSDALFSYIPPTNLFGWVASPLRYLVPFRKFVRFNRTIIKITHSPMLFAIFTYERLFLVRNAYTPMDLVERKAPRRGRLPAFTMKNSGPFSPGTRLREPSIVSFHKDRALEEVFRRPFDMTTRTISQHSNPDQRKATVVDNWMQDMGDEGGASPPMEQPRSVLERLENRRPGIRRAQTSANRVSTVKRDFSANSRSVLSDPEDLASTIFPRPTPMRIEEETDLEMEREDLPQETDADGDDELLTNDGDNITATGYDRTPTGTPDLVERKGPSTTKPTVKDYFEGADLQTMSSVPNATRARLMSGEHKREGHQRTVSQSTMVFSPIVEQGYTSSASERVPEPSRPTTAKQHSGGSAPLLQSAPQSSGRKTPRTSNPSRPRPNMPNRLAQYTAPNIRFDRFGDSTRRANRKPSFNALALDLASDYGDHHRRGLTPEPLSPGYQPSIPASFSEQMLREREVALDKERRRQEQRRRSQEEEKGMVGRIMLTRMNTLEEGFREILREVRDLAYTSRGTSDAGLTGIMNSRSSLTVPPSSDGNVLSRPKTPVSRTGGASERARSPKKGKGKNKSKGKNSINSSSEADPISPLTIQDPAQATGPSDEPETPGTVRALSTHAEEGYDDDKHDTEKE